MPFIRERLIVFFFPLLLAAPFLRRAYFVDDSYFVQIASWLKDHPGRPYDFTVDDAKIGAHGWEQDGFVRMVNPLGHHYYLSLLMKIGGDRTWWLRFGCVLLSCWAALFLFELARRWTYHPLLATLLVLSAPGFALSSYSLLIDSTAGLFFLAALFFFVRGVETDRLPYYLASGLAMGLAILSKYPAVLIMPLTAVWILFRWKKAGRRWPALLSWGIGLGFLLAYSLWTKNLYGAPHILAASHRMVQTTGWPKLLVFLVFFSGSSLLPLIAWPVVSRRTRLFSIVGVLGLLYFFSSPLGGFSPAQSFLLGLWSVTSLLFLWAFFAQRAAWEKPKDPFLFLWLLSFLGMMAMVMGWVAARYYVIALPAIGFLATRLVEIKWPDRASSLLKRLFVFNLIASLVLGWVDYKQADPSRELPALLESRGFLGGDRHFYLGDSFTMSYLGDHGWVPCFPETELRPGDWILAKEVTMPQSWFYRRRLPLRLLAEFNFPSRVPIKVMDNNGSAGWYASVWGALPFTFSSSPWERFRLFEIAAPDHPA